MNTQSVLSLHRVTNALYTVVVSVLPASLSLSEDKLLGAASLLDGYKPPQPPTPSQAEKPHF